MLSGTGLSGSDRDDKVSNRLDTSKEAVVSNKDVISAFVFATRIVQSLYSLNPKFQASSHLL